MISKRGEQLHGQQVQQDGCRDSCCNGHFPARACQADLNGFEEGLEHGWLGLMVDPNMELISSRGNVIAIDHHA